MNYENENNFLETLIKRISKLPGLGPRSARRIIFYLLKNKELHLRPLIESLIQVDKNIQNISSKNFKERRVCLSGIAIGWLKMTE